MSSITSVCTVQVLIVEVGVIFACWGAFNAPGNMSFFKSYQLVAVLMAECEPHLSNDWAVLTVIPVSREHTQALIYKGTQTYTLEKAGRRRVGEWHKDTRNSTNGSWWRFLGESMWGGRHELWILLYWIRLGFTGKWRSPGMIQTPCMCPRLVHRPAHSIPVASNALLMCSLPPFAY